MKVEKPETVADLISKELSYFLEPRNITRTLQGNSSKEQKLKAFSRIQPNIKLIEQAGRFNDVLISLMHCLGDGDLDIANEAKNTLYFLGQEPELGSNSAASFEKLIKRYELTRDAITKGLKDQNESIRLSAARLVGELRINSEDAALGLISLLGDGSSEVKKIATWSIGAMGDQMPHLEEALPELLGLLRDRDFDTKLTAAETLVKLNRQVNGAIPVLTDALDGKDFAFSARAEQALLSIKGEEGKSEIVRLINKGSSAAKARVLEALGDASKETLLNLARLAENKDIEALEAIKNIAYGQEARTEAFTLLLDAAKRKDPTAFSALAELQQQCLLTEEQAKVAALVLVENLNDSNIHSQAMTALESFGEYCVQAIDKSKLDQNGLLSAVVILGRVKSPVKKEEQQRIQLLEAYSLFEGEQVKLAAIRQLGNVRQSDFSGTIILHLCDLIGSQDLAVKSAAVDSLVKFGDEAAPILLSTLNPKNLIELGNKILVLGKIGPDMNNTNVEQTAVSLKTLLNRFKNDGSLLERNVREVIFWSIEQLGVRARKPFIEAIRNGESQGVDNSQEALKKLACEKDGNIVIQDLLQIANNPEGYYLGSEMASTILVSVADKYPELTIAFIAESLRVRIHPSEELDALRKIGTPAKVALPQLENIVINTEAELEHRLKAASAMISNADTDTAAQFSDTLCSLLRLCGGIESGESKFLENLVKLASKSEEVANKLSDELINRNHETRIDYDTRIDILRLIQKFGIKGARARNTLTQIAKEGFFGNLDESNRKYSSGEALLALSKVEGGEKVAIELAREEIEKHTTMRDGKTSGKVFYALKLIEDLGEKVKSTSGILSELIRNRTDNRDLRARAAAALVSTGEQHNHNNDIEISDCLVNAFGSDSNIGSMQFKYSSNSFDHTYAQALAQIGIYHRNAIDNLCLGMMMSGNHTGGKILPVLINVIRTGKKQGISFARDKKLKELYDFLEWRPSHDSNGVMRIVLKSLYDGNAPDQLTINQILNLCLSMNTTEPP